MATEPLTAEEEARVRVESLRRMGMAAVYSLVGGGEDVITIARLLATLDAARAQAAEVGEVGIDAIDSFLAAAEADMRHRMRDGERRGWSDSWRHDYPDAAVTGRLNRALGHLFVALGRYRDGSVGIDELRKRAADVANQAFMLADPDRLAALARTGGSTE